MKLCKGYNRHDGISFRGVVLRVDFPSVQIQPIIFNWSWFYWKISWILQ